MYKNKTRKLVLENSNQYISDRLILGEISNTLRFQADIDNFLDIPAGQFKLEDVSVITEDLDFGRLCSMMEKMDYPCVVYNGNIITPWDVWLTLLSENLTEPLTTRHEEKNTCPHCGKDIT